MCGIVKKLEKDKYFFVIKQQYVAKMQDERFSILEDVKTVNIGNDMAVTLSIGIGSMAIFGSYLKKDKTLLGEAVNVAGLDTFVAIVAGLIIFPACFSFGVNPDSGPSLIFITLPNVFLSMTGGRIWGCSILPIYGFSHHYLQSLQYLKILLPAQWNYGTSQERNQ